MRLYLDSNVFDHILAAAEEERFDQWLGSEGHLLALSNVHLHEVLPIADFRKAWRIDRPPNLASARVPWSVLGIYTRRRCVVRSVAYVHIGFARSRIVAVHSTSIAVTIGSR
jgi:hypothetical protein